jgi:hypothetical protein
VYCQQQLPDGLPRLLVTRGTVELSGQSVPTEGDGAVRYRTPAVAPVEDWRPPTPAELGQLLAAPDAVQPLAPELTISVLAMPEAVLAPFARLDLRHADSVAACKALLDSPAYADAVGEAVFELWPYFESPDGVRLLGTCVQAPNLRTTTTHRDTGGAYSFSGLHIDDWSARPIAQRGDCDRQMSINLGRSDRFLMFIAVPAAEIARRIDGHGLGTYTEVGAEFLRRHPDCELVKVRVRPGEAYIAPTENLIHDGTTRGSATPDITLNLRGRLRTTADRQVQL